MKFEDVVGQEDVKEYLIEAVGNQRLPHAIMMLGQSGYGTLAMALALAQYLMCENRTKYDACGACSQCHKSQKLIHPDIHFTYPTTGSKVTSVDLISQWRKFLDEGVYQQAQDWFSFIGGDNKQGNITKAECARILKALSLKTFEGQFKVHILWMAEYLGKQGNRLLKIIEEPPENTIFIMIAEHQESILNTIISRCQLVSLKPIEDDVVSAYLRNSMKDVDESAAAQISFLASGNLGEALRLAQHPEQVTANHWLEWMRVTYKGSGIEMAKWIDGFVKLDRESQKNFVQYGLYFIREMMLTKVNPLHRIRLMERETTALKRLSDLIDLSPIQQMVELIDQSVFHLERNANVRIMMLDVSIQMHYLLRNEVEKLSVVREMS